MDEIGNQCTMDLRPPYPVHHQISICRDVDGRAYSKLPEVTYLQLQTPSGRERKMALSLTSYT
jgi:hypothetical protein